MKDVEFIKKINKLAAINKVVLVYSSLWCSIDISISGLKRPTWARERKYFWKVVVY